MKTKWWWMPMLPLLVSMTVPAAEIKKSPNDTRSYQSLVLPNHLQVLLISDPDTDKSAAAMDVNAGSADEPRQWPGLAHFLEHMLFLGTSKYPKADAYQDFINQHGGSQNAYTAFDHTNFFFDIDPDQLAPALDRFSQFFIAPLFSEDYVSREAHAVDSEYKAKIREDGRRLYETMRETYNPDHPMSRFSVGNLQTLQDHGELKIRDALINFYQHSYSASRMRLVVLGKEPLPQLASWVTQYFASIADHPTTISRQMPPLFTSSQLPAELQLTPIREVRTLSLTFPLPPLRQYEDNKPVQYLASLLGDEGKGSILALLKSLGWASSLGAGVGYNGPDASTMQISLSLTAAGQVHINDIVSLVFAYLRKIEEGGIDEWRFREMAKLADIDFRFQEKVPPINWVSGLANALQDHTAEQVLYSSYDYHNYDAQVIRQFLDYLTPDHLLVTLMAPGLSTDKTSRWYDVPYRYTQLKQEQWQVSHPEWLQQLALPAANPFIAEQLHVLKSNDSAKPELLQQQPGFSFWYQQDTSFGTPKADFFVNLRSAKTNDTARDTALSELYTRMVEEQLNTLTYPAFVAGLEFELYRHIRGISFKITGYNDKQSVLLDELQHALLQPQWNQVRFDQIKEDYLDELRNRKESMPYKVSMGRLSERLMPSFHTSAELISALQGISLNDLQQFVPAWRQQIQVVVLAHGNLDQQQARSMAEKVKHAWLDKAQPADVPRATIDALPAGYQESISEQGPHKDTAITWYWQADQDDLKHRAAFALLSQIISTPFYADLRTRQQLGYIVFATPMPIMDWPGIGLVLQSPSADAATLTTRVDQFMQDFRTQLQHLSNDQLQTFKQGLMSDLSKPDQTLYERSNYYWREIDRGAYDFDSRNELLKAIGTIDKATLLTIYDHMLSPQQRRALIVTASPEPQK